MTTILATLDGNTIHFPKPVNLSHPQKVLVTFLEHADEGEDWMSFALSNLGHAYSENEPDYDNVSLREPNPGYNA